MSKTVLLVQHHETLQKSVYQLIYQDLFVSPGTAVPIDTSVRLGRLWRSESPENGKHRGVHGHFEGKKYGVHFGSQKCTLARIFALKSVLYQVFAPGRAADHV